VPTDPLAPRPISVLAFGIMLVLSVGTTTIVSLSTRGWLYARRVLVALVGSVAFGALLGAVASPFFG